LKLDQKRRIEIVNEILASNENYHWMRQYHDDIHYSGYQAVAEYINTELGGADFTLVASVGSGCSSGGISSALRSAGQDVKLIGIQPFGSVTFGSEYVEDPGIIMAGIGSSIPFDNVHHDLYDTIHWVSFDYARNRAIALLKDHAVFAGLSSGCCYLVASREVKRDPGQNVLFIAPDIGNRYVEGVFAHYGQAKPIEDLAPNIITRHSELALPWACMEWRRRPEPCKRLWHSDRITDKPPSDADSGGKSNMVPREGKNSSV